MYFRGKLYHYSSRLKLTKSTKGLDSSKKDITRINTTTFLKDMFRHAYASLIEWMSYNRWVVSELMNKLLTIMTYALQVI